jgi:hypothetical protein
LNSIGKTEGPEINTASIRLPRRGTFLFPRLSLLDVEVVGMGCSQGAEDMERLGREKAINWR